MNNELSDCVLRIMITEPTLEQLKADPVHDEFMALLARADAKLLDALPRSDGPSSA